MKKFFLVLILFSTLIFTGYLQSNVEAISALDPKNTYVLLVGVLTWKDKNLDSFSPYHRKDAELYRTLLGRGVPQKNIVHLIDAHFGLRMAQLLKPAVDLSSGAIGFLLSRHWVYNEPSSHA